MPSLLLVLILGAAPHRRAPAPSPPPPLKTLRILHVFDTSDEDLRPSLLRDEARLKALWRGTIPPSRYRLSTLKGKDVTPALINRALALIKRDTTPHDAILLYYGGHGALKGGNHVLKLDCGHDVPRDDLRRRLEGCKAGLAVLLTDCCSTREKADKKDAHEVAARSGDGIAPTVRSLFFQSRGLVDITAASAEAAWSDDLNGGLFTRTLVRLLAEPDEDMTWGRFFPALQGETQVFFKEWSAKMRARYPDSRIRAETQKPFAFRLGGKLAYGAVQVENAKTGILRYKFRWEGETGWTEWDLKPGETKIHTVPLRPGEREFPPRLEILREGAGRTDRLRSLLWEKDAAPENLDRRYRIMK